jgi:hypothetical protein
LLRNREIEFQQGGGGDELVEMINIRVSTTEFKSEWDGGKALILIAVPDIRFDRRVILADCVVV